MTTAERTTLTTLAVELRRLARLSRALPDAEVEDGVGEVADQLDLLACGIHVIRPAEHDRP